MNSGDHAVKDPGKPDASRLMRAESLGQSQSATTKSPVVHYSPILFPMDVGIEETGSRICRQFDTDEPRVQAHSRGGCAVTWPRRRRGRANGHRNAAD